MLKRVTSLRSRDLVRYIWTAALALAATTGLFFAYYYQDRYVRSGDVSPLDISIERMESAVTENPSDPRARVQLAEFYLGKGMYAQSLELTGQVLALYPEDNDALLISGIAATRSGDPQQALLPLEKFVSLRKDSPMAMEDPQLQTAYYFIGENYNALGQPEQAISALHQALQITPTDADTLYQLGLASKSLGNLEEAAEFFTQAVLLVPDFTEAYGGMAEVYDGLNMPDHAEYAAGMQDFASRDYRSAEKHLSTAAAALPAFAPAHYGLALTYEKLNRMNDALISIRVASILDPENFAIMQTLGRIEAAIQSGG